MKLATRLGRINVLLLAVLSVSVPAYSTDLLITLRPDSVRHRQTGETQIQVHNAFIHYGSFSGDERKGFLARPAKEQRDFNGKPVMELVRWSEVKSMLLVCDSSGQAPDCSGTITKRNGTNKSVVVVGGLYFGGSTSVKTEDVISFNEPSTVEPVPSELSGKLKRK